MSRQAQLLLIWIITSFVASFIALQYTSAAYNQADEAWVPVGNDSFYHARRILDAAEPGGQLMQFDSKMHVPEGSWITWPWAYDWLMAKALQGWRLLNSQADSMFFLTHVPVYWIFINAALLLGICVALGLATQWIVPVMAGFAISPLTALLHGVGFIDHHYIEFSFVLATVLTGLLWLNEPATRTRAAVLGITLGLAPAFHNGLFILQAPVLLTLVLLWFRGRLPQRDSLLTMAAALLLTTVLVLLPSTAFRQGQFQFAVLSWFHFYIAGASVIIVAYLARFSSGGKTFAGLAALGLALLLPIWQDTIGGAAFLSSDLLMLDQVAETRSPIDIALSLGGIREASGYYSLFGLLAPLLIPAYLWFGWRTQNPARLFLAVMIVFGVTLLLSQFRLQYFGSFALLLGWVVLANDYWPAFNRKPALGLLAGVAIVLVAFRYSFTDRMHGNYSLGLDPGYEDNYALFQELGKVCAANPGTVLADNDFGHYIRYHTDCGVIANNFLMTPQHEDKLREMQALLELSPEEFLAAAPTDMRYVLTRLFGFYIALYNGKTQQDEYRLTSTEYLQENNDRLSFELNTRNDLPGQYVLLAEIPLDAQRGFARSRLLEIRPAADPETRSR